MSYTSLIGNSISKHLFWAMNPQGFIAYFYQNGVVCAANIYIKQQITLHMQTGPFASWSFDWQ